MKGLQKPFLSVGRLLTREIPPLTLARQSSSVFLSPLSIAPLTRFHSQQRIHFFLRSFIETRSSPHLWPLSSIRPYHAMKIKESAVVSANEAPAKELESVKVVIERVTSASILSDGGSDAKTPSVTDSTSSTVSKSQATTTSKPIGRSIECEEIIRLVAEGKKVLLIDVRNRTDVAVTGSIDGAVNVPLSELKTALLMDGVDFLNTYGAKKPEKNDRRHIVFYGQGAVKSNAALEIAGKLGFKYALRMKGGYDEWIEKTHLDGKI